MQKLQNAQTSTKRPAKEQPGFSDETSTTCSLASPLAGPPACGLFILIGWNEIFSRSRYLVAHQNEFSMGAINRGRKFQSRKQSYEFPILE